MTKRGVALTAQVLAAVSRHRLLQAGDRVLVALSGGPDSVALLHALWSLRGELGIDVCAAHLDHRIRGRAAAADAAFARALARRLGVRFAGGSADVPALARGRGQSLETAARQARQRFLAAAAARLGCTAIATGHTADDQAETLLMRLLRGTGLAGLAGIPRRNGAYVRPLLDVRRADVLRYLTGQRLAFRRDATNDDDAITRNRIRRRLIPELRRYSPRIVEHLCRLADTAGDDLAMIGREVDQAFAACAEHAKSQIRIDLKLFSGYNKGLQRQVIRRCAQRIAGPEALPTCERTAAALELLGRPAVGKRCLLAPGVWVRIGYGRAVVGPASRPAAGPVAGAATLTVPGLHRVGGHAISARTVGRAAAGRPPRTDPDVAWFDWDGLRRGGLTAGPRRRGERIVPFGGRHSREIAKLMIDAKLPSVRRDRWPIVRWRGRAIWVPGERRSDAAPVTPATTTVLILEHTDDEA
ncbi:MAG: tRNA lysidine(34) synthetase TilS [Candidatus Edwardsbacteria bacterium]|jgi:tRNA(Ile)-lysidine synthase|nr:tRNA lysidine(34) synthetase TilS [Candidatus Edwardsbacteria bacterium]